MSFDEAQALEILIHDRYADVLEIIGLIRSGTGAHAVACIDRQDGHQITFFHENDLHSDYGERERR